MLESFVNPIYNSVVNGSISCCHPLNISTLNFIGSLGFFYLPGEQTYLINGEKCIYEYNKYPNKYKYINI